MKVIRSAMQNRLEVIGGIAALIVCAGLIYGLAENKRTSNFGQLYVIENGKWLPVERFNPIR